MLSSERLQSLLRKMNLSEAEIGLFIYIKDHAGCSMADAVTGLTWSRSTLYRAYESLKEKGLIVSSSESWKANLRVSGFKTMIKKLQNESAKQKYLLQVLKSLDKVSEFAPHATLSNIEVLDEAETIDRYMQLSEMDWDSIFVLGNWEDLNINNNLIPTEQKFVKNRINRGAQAFVVVTKDGPATREIIDFNHSRDQKEFRKSNIMNQMKDSGFLVNVFEGNNYVHLWDVDKKNTINSTFIESYSLSNFYKDLIYSYTS